MSAHWTRPAEGWRFVDQCGTHIALTPLYARSPQGTRAYGHIQRGRELAIQLNINANDAREDGRALKLMIAVAAGLPEHYLADSNNGNRATAAERGMLTLLKYQRRQRYIHYILRCILDRVPAEAKKAGRLGENVNLSYHLIFPEINLDDNKNWPEPSTPSSPLGIKAESAMRLPYACSSNSLARISASTMSSPVYAMSRPLSNKQANHSRSPESCLGPGFLSLKIKMARSSHYLICSEDGLGILCCLSLIYYPCLFIK